MVSTVSAEDELMSQVLEPRTYHREECAVFRKTDEAFGGLSNMAPGYAVRVNGVLIPTVEALYQACRFPHMPEVQRLILEQRSPMTAKMVGKPYRDNSRPDWDRVRVKIMRWCLRLKLLAHRSTFSALLLSTGDRPIVEDSRKDDFWGALRLDSKTLVGRNVLGRLLMELREEIKSGTEPRLLEPPAIPSFLLYGQAITLFGFRTDKVAERPLMVKSDRIIQKASSPALFPEFLSKRKEQASLEHIQPEESQEFGLLRGAKPYVEYRQSGSPWLGNIPSHWKLPRLGSVLCERKETNETRQIDQVLSVMKGIGVIRYEEKGNVGNKRSEDTGRYKIVRPDDIVVNCMNVIIGSVGRSRYTGCLSPVYYVLRRRDETNNPKYLALVFATKSFHESLVRIGNGILAHRMRIPMELLKCEAFPVPPADEQDAIVRFLDWANGRLERAIRAKRKVIALLNEQKQAIIHRAVTRGLDSSVPLKPSEIPWLGDIPQHWNTPLFGRLLKRVEQGWSPVAAEGELASDQWAVLTLSSVRKGLFNSSAIKPIAPSADIPKEIEIADGDILLTRSNTRDRVGDVCIVRAPRPRTILCDLIYRLQLREGSIDPQFLVYQMLSTVGRGQVERDARGSSGTMPKISQSHIKSWRILLPPIEEQRLISKQIEHAIAPIGLTVKRLENEIDLIREYQTRLVADVVTGKLDVRDAVNHLPDTAEPDIPDVDGAELDPEEADEEVVA